MTNVVDTGGHPTDAFGAGEHMDQDRILRHIEGLATAEEARVAERHLVLCKDCRRALVETATRRRSAARRRAVRRVGPMAAVTVVAISIGTMLYRSRSPERPVLRGEQVAVAFAPVSPAPNASIAADSVLFVWASAAMDAYYALTVTDGSGDVVWSTQVADTSVSLPDTVSLEAGAYYWFVDAFLDGANTATTRVQSFRVR